MPLMASITQSVPGQIQNAFAWGIDECASNHLLSPKYGRLIHENDVRKTQGCVLLMKKLRLRHTAEGISLVKR